MVPLPFSVDEVEIESSFDAEFGRFLCLLNLQ